MRKSRFPPEGFQIAELRLNSSKTYSCLCFLFEKTIRKNENAQKDAQESISPGGVPNTGVVAQLLRKCVVFQCCRFFEKPVSNEKSVWDETGLDETGFE